MRKSRFILAAVVAPLVLWPIILRADDREVRQLGWHPARLKAVFDHASTLSTDTLLIVTDGKTVGAFGDPSRRYNVHSIRKALLSALVGQHVGAGPKQLRLNATLAELGIDDSPGPLTPLQKQATVLHLIKSISGINHAAAAEGGQAAERTRRLGTGENVPGTKWAYNNWDYNALTTIFEARTGLTVAKAFDAGIAQPTGMRDFRRSHVRYIYSSRRSRHRAAMFRMSGRDLAKFGMLYLNKGSAKGRQLIPEAWIGRVPRDAVDTGIGGLRAGHSYLWWVPAADTRLPGGTFWALGLGQQAVFVIPAWRTVIVHQSDTTEFFRRFLKMIRSTGTTPDVALDSLIRHCLDRANRSSDYCKKHRFILRGEFRRLILRIADARL